MLVLGMDTSSQAATAAVLRDGIILGEYTLNHKKTHSVKMLPLIEQLLADTELTLNDIDVFACGTGPGSFTGVRIGVATAKGFAQALGKQVVSLNTLEILCGSLPIFSWPAGSRSFCPGRRTFLRHLPEHKRAGGASAAVRYDGE